MLKELSQNNQKEENIMMGVILPPEIGAVLEEMFGEIAASPNGSWMNGHVEFDSAEYHGITVSHLHVKNKNI